MGKVIQLFGRQAGKATAHELAASEYKAGAEVRWGRFQGTICEVDYTPGKLRPILVDFPGAAILEFSSTGFRPEDPWLPDTQLIVIPKEDKNEPVTTT